MHHILFYDYVADIVGRRGPYREAHLERIRAEKAAGRLVMAGALGDPPHGGVFVFAPGVARDEIEEFAAADPYAEAGLVVTHRVEPWNVV